MKVNMRKHSSAMYALRRRYRGFTTYPCIIVDYREFVKKFQLMLPEYAVHLVGGGMGLAHPSLLSIMLPRSLRVKTDHLPVIVRKLLTYHNIQRSGLAIMGVFHDPNRRGKQWVCNMTVNKVVAISLHSTEKEARERYMELERMVEYGVFLDHFQREPLTNLDFGNCIVDEGKSGERCDRGIECPSYSTCLHQASKYDIKGWRIHDTTTTRDA